ALKLFRIHNKRYPKGKLRFRVLKRIGQLCAKLGFLRQAVGVFQRLKQENHALNDREVDFMLAELYFRTGNYVKALNLYEKYGDWSIDKSQLPFLKYKIATCKYDLKRYSQALPELLEIMGTTGSPEVENDIKAMLSHIYAERGDYRSSLIYAGGFLKESEQVNRLVGSSLSLLAGNASREILEELIIKSPPNPGYSEPLGEALFRLSEFYIRDGREIQASDLLEYLINSYPHYSKINPARKKYRSLKIHNRKIGVILSLSGEYQVFGRQVLNGIELAVEKANRKQDKQSRLALIIKDSQGSAEKAEQAARELIKTDQVIAIIGPVLSKTTKAAARVAEQLNTPLLTPSAGEANIPEIGRNIFRNALTNQHQGITIAEFAVSRLCQKEFGILYPDNTYGRELMDIFKKRIEELGGQILTVNGYDEDTTDFKPQIEIIHQMNPKVLFIPDYYNKVIMIAPQLAYYQPEETVIEKEEASLNDRYFNWDPKLDWLGPKPQGVKTKLEQFMKSSKRSDDKPGKRRFILLGTDGWNSPKLLKEGSKYLEKAVFTSGFFSKGSSPLVKDFTKDFQRRFRTSPDLLAAQSFDAANFIISGLNQGNCTREMIRDYLASIKDFKGISGVTTMLPSGESDKRLTLLTARRGKIRQLRSNERWFCTTERNGPRLYAKLSEGGYEIEKDYEGTIPELTRLKQQEIRKKADHSEVKDTIPEYIPSFFTGEEISLDSLAGQPERNRSFPDRFDLEVFP
ncbi:MAG: ABC transporter substrate-binding protein, partial [bacterium]